MQLQFQNIFLTDLNPLKILQQSLIRVMPIYHKILAIGSPLFLWIPIDYWMRSYLNPQVEVLVNNNLTPWIDSSSMPFVIKIAFALAILLKEEIVFTIIFLLYAVFIGSFSSIAVISFAHHNIVKLPQKSDQDSRKSRAKREFAYIYSLKKSINLLSASFVVMLNALFRIFLGSIIVLMLVGIVSSFLLLIFNDYLSNVDLSIDELLSMMENEWEVLLNILNLFVVLVSLTPLIVFAINVFFFPFFIAVDSDLAEESIRHSRGLVEGRWWQAAFVVSFGILVVKIYEYLVGIVLDHLAPSIFSAYAEPSKDIARFLIFPFQVAYITLIFDRLRHSKATAVPRRVRDTST